MRKKKGLVPKCYNTALKLNRSINTERNTQGNSAKLSLPVYNITDEKLGQQQDDLTVVIEEVRSRARIKGALGVSGSQAISQRCLC